MSNLFCRLLFLFYFSGPAKKKILVRQYKFVVKLYCMGKIKGLPDVIEYEDELNDEFSIAEIKAKTIDEKYRYHPKTIFGRFFSTFLYRFFALPVSWFYLKIKFHHKIKGKKLLKKGKKTGYFIYGNHTQIIGDAFMPCHISHPKRSSVIVHPNNVSMPGLGKIIPYLGAIPLPDTIGARENFTNEIARRIKKKNAIFIYPEAHLWPYYTHIRPFKDTSFTYPVSLKVPVYCFVNTYKRRKNPNKVQIITRIRGPFYPDASLSSKDAIKKLRDEVYNSMVELTEFNEVELIEYRKKVSS